MNLRLERLEIENFKGIKAACYEFGDETRIFGANATGKSSIVDAYSWLMFNKDARGNAPGSDKFREKPLDSNGAEVHYIDTTVTAHFRLDGSPLVLRRTQRENWVKMRGAAEATYRGNASLYWINDVETKASDFTARINSIATGDVFRLITTLGAFTALDWKTRRALLISMCGIDVDARLLEREEYAQIAAEARERNVSVDDLRKILTDRKTKIARELQLIPARIDENRRNRPEVSAQAVKDAKYHIEEAESALRSCEKSIAEISAGTTSDGDVYMQILDLEQKIVQIKREKQNEFLEKRRALKSELDAQESAAKIAERAEANAQTIARNARAAADAAAEVLARLRTDYKREFDSKFVPTDQPDICPTCHQRISAELRENAQALARREFEAAKKSALSSINQRGKEKRAALEELEQAAQAAQADCERAAETAAEARKKALAAREAYDAYPATLPPIEDARITELEERIAQLKEKQHFSPDEKLRQFEDRKRELEARIKAAKEVLAQEERAAQIDERIRELESDQAEKGRQRADIEVMIYTIEQFIADRCGQLEESINEKFPTVRWKLFDRQINGALVDCCECMIPGESALVSYSATNTAARVNADIEITAALSKHYGVTAPVFFDNAESVNYVARPAGQLIALSVSSDPVLRIETIYNEKEAA